MINTMEEKILLNADEPAFMIIGSQSYDEIAYKPNIRWRTTIIVLRVNDMFREKYVQLAGNFNVAEGPAIGPAFKNFSEFREEVCTRVCNENATLFHLGFNTFIIRWARLI